MSPAPHDLSLPHDISGTGLVTKCPPECRAHCRWLDQRAPSKGLMQTLPPDFAKGYEPLGDETWGGEELGVRAANPGVPEVIKLPKNLFHDNKTCTCKLCLREREIEGMKTGPKVDVSQEFLDDTKIPDLFGVLPGSPEPQPITALFGDEQDVSPRESALREAISLITGDRNAQYGPPTQDFQRTADLLSALGFRFCEYNTPSGAPLYRELTASDVAIIMIELKMSRIIQSRGKRDSWVDLAGYAGCGYECTIEENA